VYPPEEESDLSIRNRVLLYKQLIHRMMDYACPTWRFAAHTYVRKLQVLQSLPCHRCPLYVSGRQIHEDVGVPLFVEHIKALIASLDSKLADMRNLLFRQLGVNLR